MPAVYHQRLHFLALPTDKNTQTILLYAMFLVIANLVVDIIYAYLDPRIRYD